MKNKVSVTDKIVAFKKANPTAKYREMAEKFKCDISLVGAALSKAGMTKPHKKATKGQKILREVLKQEPPVNLHALNVEIYKLRQQISGYVAVVSYLENKLGIGAKNGPAI